MTDYRTFEWRDEQENTRYPFTPAASLQNRAGSFLPESIFLDAAIYAIGAVAPLYLSRVVAAADSVTLYVGDASDPNLASVSFDPTDPPNLLSLTDVYGRSAGVLVSEANRLTAFQAWPLGEHLFEPDQTAFCASTVHATPEAGVRGFLLDDGTLLTGEVWLVGDDGVVLRRTSPPTSPWCNGVANLDHLIRVDVVGDPVFRRRLCDDLSLFTTPRLIRTVTIRKDETEYILTPDDAGNMRILVGNDLDASTVLRLRPDGNGLLLEAVGLAPT